MEEMVLIANELRNPAGSHDLHHTDWTICKLVQIERLQSVLCHLLLEEAKVFILDRPHHVVLVDRAWLVEPVDTVFNNIGLMLFPDLSQRFASSDPIHLDVFSDLLNYLPLCEPMVLLDILFIIVAEDVLAILIILNIVVFHDIIRAAWVIVNSFSPPFGNKLVCFVLYALASTAE